MSVDINVELGELLSRKACAKIIKHIIKFIAYNNQQIPYPYEGFQLLVAKKKRHSKADGNKPMSFKQMKANNFYEKIEGIHDAFETTFKSIEEELLQGSAIKEVVVVLGSTIVSPKHVYRVRIPGQLTNDECDSKIRSHLFKIYRSIISSSGVHSSKISGLTNIFVLVNGECNPGWFIPKFDYRIPPGASQTVISFVDGPGSCRTCSDNAVDCLHGNGNELRISKEPEASTYDHWFQAKQALSGFQDMKIDGVSVYNMLND